MPLDADYVRALRFPSSERVITDKDAMLYALSIGLGRDPLDAHDLRYVYEKDLVVFPTMPIVIGHPGDWMRDPRSGITPTMVVHGAQRLWSVAPLPIGEVVATTDRIANIFDKRERGAMLVLERLITRRSDGGLIARSESTIICRADGGFGGASGPTYGFVPVPDRVGDRTVDIATEPNMALLYRLNNDRNPLHVEPAFARRAGFARPILHGLATYGAAAVAIARTFPNARLNEIEARFSKPVLPGETISIDMWDERDGVAFRARVASRNAVVLDRGFARLGSEV